MRNGTPVKILFVDGHAANRQTIGQTLREAGDIILEAESGSGALKLVTSDVTLVILGSPFPDMSAAEIRQHLQSDPATAGIPILRLEPLSSLDGASVAAPDDEGYRVHPVPRTALAVAVEAVIRTLPERVRLHEEIPTSHSIVAVTPVDFDIAERRRAAEKLWLHDQALRAATGGILITDPHLPDNPIIFANLSFEKMTGYTSHEILGRNCRFLQGPDTDPTAVLTMRQAVAQGQPCAVVLVNHRKNGTPFWNSVSIGPIRNADGKITHFVGTQIDVTPVKRLEEQFQQAQKMEAIGRLASGVAHDFSNALTIIAGYGHQLLETLPEADPARELVAEMIAAGERSQALTQQLLVFSRKAIVEPRVLNLREVVMGADKLLRRVIGEDIDLKTTFEDQTASVRIDPHQLSQVLVNLAVNARDAMRNGGKLTIEVGNVNLDDSYLSGCPEARAGQHVRLVVSDTGDGIPAKVLPHIWEPFYTTKEAGQGTGLGLSFVHGVVRQAGGHVRVYTEVGVGTAFNLYFPKAVEVPLPRRPDGERPFTPRGTETILLAEDEDGVRSLARRVLTMNGYTVIEAANGAEAVRLAQEHVGTLHLLITDVVMPRLGGRETADQVNALHPHARVLFMSGYTDDAIMRHGILSNEVAFLNKPFSPLALAQKVRAVLDAHRN